jgi:NitT/TauT family transport system substrate-binding protein
MKLPNTSRSRGRLHPRGFRVVSSIAVIGALALTATACSPTTGEDGQELDSVTITISQWPTAPYAATYMVGMEMGLFEDEGIKIEGVVPGTGGGTTVRSLTSGGLDFGVVSVSSLVTAAIVGAPLKMLATENGTLANQAWVTRADADYDSLDDFCGHGVWGITSPGSTTEGTTALMIEEQGIDPSCITTAAAGGLAEGLTLLESGAIDSAIIWEPVLTEELQKGNVKVILSPADELPQYTQTVIVAGTQLIQQNPDLVERFMTAHRKAQDWLIANPEEAGKIYAEGAGIDEDIAVAGITRLAGLEDYYTEQFSVTGLTTVVDGMVAVGQNLEKTGIPWADIMDQSFIAKDRRIDPADLPLQPPS